MNGYNALRQRQQGVILLMTLIFLFAMTVLAFTTVRLNTAVTRISTNHVNNEISFQTTEGANNQIAQNIIKGQYLNNNFVNNTGGFYLLNTSSAPLWSNISWKGGNVQTGFQGSADAPASFFIEQLPSVIKPGQNMNRTINIYRITTRATNSANNTASIMQTTVQIPQ